MKKIDLQITVFLTMLVLASLITSTAIGITYYKKPDDNKK